MDCKAFRQGWGRSLGCAEVSWRIASLGGHQSLSVIPGEGPGSAG